MNIYVGGISFDANEDDLRKAFEAFGTVDSVAIITDRNTGKSKGFGFLEMPNGNEAKAAIEGMNGKDVKGSALNVNEARPRKERQDNRGGGGGGNRY